MINIKADSPSGPLTIDLDVTETNILHESMIVRKLAARRKIQELEESKNIDEYGYEENEIENDVKENIIRLGLENSLCSQYTSFVGIDDSTGDTLTDKPMSTREIKNQVAAGFGGYGGSGMVFGGLYFCP